MKRLAAFVLLFPLGGCFEAAEPAHSVSDYLNDELLRSAQLMKCRENPGKLGDTPDCRNAFEADGRTRLRQMNRALGG